ncbi:basic amino acid ABC transporter substrate-binding protein [Desulfoscipio geothermicus]|uniref:Polar amino acid transport system substrate-binding protein n=1 Tax=Desulfoscipio geothermicus DSM 3669 TaxID=1121426 RepID=A0A1I6EJF3_9FIRM|nr:basic amino acid ABC transporter substrate-binding protein [Desulfoscipio geothermicus]SFR17870.1 polar amino acid transport system substrate-binding protein [Desulfoscipio geothermicus DSM 3669]
MKKWFKVSLVALTALTLVVVAAGCGGGEKAKETAGEGEKQGAQTTKLVFGSDTAYAPFEFMGEDGKLKGFDVDLIDAIEEVAGVEIEIKGMNFDGIVPALETASIDGAISAMTITEERKQKVDFSVPYYASGQCVAVRADNETIKGFDDLEGKKIGVQIGTTGSIEANKVPNAEITDYNIIGDAFLDLKSGAVDAVVNDFPVTAYYIQQGNDDVKIVGDMKTSEHYGIAVPKQKPEVLEMINDALATLKENGKFDEIYKKWFGAAPPEYLPGEPQS